jgi:hypothetical protein
MEIKILSVYNDEYEIKDFLLKYDFISEEQHNDEEYDLLVWLEGDCDRMTFDGNDIYFGEFHSDYVWDGCKVVICTADCQDEIDELYEFFNGETWVGVSDDIDIDVFLKSEEDKVLYRGGVGPVYAVYCKKNEESIA